MTPETAIETLGELLKRVDATRSHLADEADEIGEQWQGLGHVGGQRADHAAALLSRLRPHLAELARFATACQEQLTGFVADPFGRSLSCEHCAATGGGCSVCRPIDGPTYSGGDR
jgi:hypothetical protein